MRRGARFGAMRQLAAPERPKITAAVLLILSACMNRLIAVEATPATRSYGTSTPPKPKAPVMQAGAAPTVVGGGDGWTSAEEGFMRWVRYIGSLQHSAYTLARNQLADHTYLVVDHAAPTVATRANYTIVGNGGAPLQLHRFSTIQAAIDSVPVNNSLRVKIFIAPGTYTEKIFVPHTKPFITLQGTNTSTTIITWNDTANKLGADGKPIGTYNSATVAIDASYFIARNITFKNAAPVPGKGSIDGQAVALRISGDAAVFLGCQFVGAQDTLYDHKGRHFFQNCYIEGSVDFIFGDGLSMYKACHLHAIGVAYQQAITAQSRGSPSDDSGFSFINCKVTGSGQLLLGRAWGTFSRVVYSFTYMDQVVLPTGWYDWGDPRRQATVYYGQFRCYGPGANALARVSWSKELTLQEAQPFLELDFIDGNEWSSFSFLP